MKRQFLYSLKFIVDSNLWIALATALFYFATLIQIEQKIQLTPIVIFLFFSSLFIYTLFQLLDIENKKTFFSKLVVVISFVSLVASIPFLSYTTLLVLLLSGLLTFFYATPLLSLGKNNFNFRKFWFLKSIIVALVWTLTCSIIPLLEYNVSTNLFVWFSVEKFLFILALSILYDIKDLEKDNLEQGMTSFVMKFGIQKTKWISSFILMFAFLLAFNIYQNQFFSILIPYVFALLVIFKLQKQSATYWFSFLIDASIIIYFLSFWLFSLDNVF